MKPVQPTRPHHPAQAQHGIVLLVALILLVVIGFSSVFILRGSSFNSLISQNQGAKQAAYQAAEVALRYCEQQILAPTAGAPAPKIIPEPEDDSVEVIAWQSQASWTANAIDVPTTALKSGSFSNAGALNYYNQTPQCLIERLPINTQVDKSSKRNFVFQITSRGFSPDYRRAANGNIISGSEVILQSVLRRASCSPILQQPDC